MHAAERRHQHRIAGVLPVQIVGVDALQQQRHQAAGDADDAAGDGERDQLGAVGVEAEARHPLLVVAQRLHQPAERRVREAPQQPQHAEHHHQREDVETDCGRKQRAGDILQAVLAAGNVGPLEGDLERDLRAGQRQQREIQAAPAEDHRADHEAEQQREGTRHDQAVISLPCGTMLPRMASA